MSGNVAYKVSGDEVTLWVERIENFNWFFTSGSLTLTLWATEEPYFSAGKGYKLATYQIGTLNAWTHTNLEVTTKFSPPPPGSYFITVVLTEWYNGADTFGAYVSLGNETFEEEVKVTDLWTDAYISSPAWNRTINEGESLDFQGLVTSGNAPFSYSWDFGGGAQNTYVEDPGWITFQRAGVYTVTFKVNDADGDTDSMSVQITVKKPISGYMITSDLWIAAVINTVEKGRIDAVWKKGGEDWTAAGDNVIWGYFYASPTQVSWGSAQNPDLFVKIWFDRNGRVDVNFFHVSVPDIDVYSDFFSDDTPEQKGTTTLSTRYIRQYYNDYDRPYGYVDGMDENTEDGISGYVANGNPDGFVIEDLGIRIGAIIRSIEKGEIDALWRQGGVSTTTGGHQVAWGIFYADPYIVNWGSEQNPDMFVKIWFDATGRVDVNFFHVSVPDIEVYSDFPNDRAYDREGCATITDRYVRYVYYRK